jgi:surfeit locus 1 family protein
LLVKKSIMNRLPVIPTILVLIAVATMIELGVWQLDRRHEKEILISRLASNRNLPPMAYPERAPVSDDAMFRKARVTCLRVTGWRVTGGATPTGQGGYRHIAECVTGAEGPGALIDMGVAADPTVKPVWTGGTVDGLITTEPNQTSLIGRAFGSAPPLRPMLVADVPARGLAASAPPSADGISNNHLAYAVQWFLFAGIALVIYAIALWRRAKV